MNRLLLTGALIALAGTAHAYNIKFSYPGDNNSTEYYGACDNGQQLKVVQKADGSFAFEGPAGNGNLNGGQGTIDSAAAAACGE